MGVTTGRGMGITPRRLEKMGKNKQYFDAFQLQIDYSAKPIVFTHESSFGEEHGFLFKLVAKSGNPEEKIYS